MIELGKRGWGPVSSNLLHVNCLANHWTSYAKGAAEAGRTADREIWRVARSIFVSEDSKVAKAYGGDDANSPYRFYMRQLLMKLGKFKRLASFKSRPDMKDEEVTLDYVLENIVIRGTVNEVVDRILALHEAIGDFGTLLYCGKDWTDVVALGRRSMELMAEKVMPAVNAAIGGRWRRNSADQARIARQPVSLSSAGWAVYQLFSCMTIIPGTVAQGGEQPASGRRLRCCCSTFLMPRPRTSIDFRPARSSGGCYISASAIACAALMVRTSLPMGRPPARRPACRSVRGRRGWSSTARASMSTCG